MASRESSGGPNPKKRDRPEDSPAEVPPSDPKRRKVGESEPSQVPQAPGPVSPALSEVQPAQLKHEDIARRRAKLALFKNKVLAQTGASPSPPPSTPSPAPVAPPKAAPKPFALAAPPKAVGKIGIAVKKVGAKAAGAVPGLFAEGEEETGPRLKKPFLALDYEHDAEFKAVPVAGDEEEDTETVLDESEARPAPGPAAPVKFAPLDLSDTENASTQLPAPVGIVQNGQGPRAAVQATAMALQTPVEAEVDPLDLYMHDISLTAAKDRSKSIIKARAPVSSGTAAPPARQSAHEEEDDFVASLALDEDDPLAKLNNTRKNLEVVDHSKIHYGAFRKDFYVEVPDIAKMSPDDVAEYRRQLDDIKIRGKNCPKPIKSFAQCGLAPKILEALKKLKYEKPTPIQAQAIPTIMSGRDVIGIAKTGSGKTLAFVLPMLRHIMDQPPLESGDGPIGLIMAPTRELAAQIHLEIKKFKKTTNISSVAVYGGQGVQGQISELKRGAEIVVCTPGRMIDILSANRGKITNLLRVTYIVLDEADRMFDMGFEQQILRIIANVRPEHQTVMFSATFPRQVEVAARKILKQPIEITVHGRSVVSDTVEQIVEVLKDESQKLPRLLELIGEWYDQAPAILIFVHRQEACDLLFRDILKSGYNCKPIHGAIEQMDRDETIAELKRGELRILVATSVAARGLDVPQLRLVVNYDVPNHLEDYVHRVGRTGRAGNKGTAVTLITPEEEMYAPDLVKALVQAKLTVPEALKALADGFESKRSSGHAKTHGSGYSGKGFKFDAEEDKKKSQELKLQATLFGGELAEEAVQDEQQLIVEDGELIGVLEVRPEDTAKTIEEIRQAQDSGKPTSAYDAAKKAELFAQALAEKAAFAQKALASVKSPDDRVPDNFEYEMEINDMPQQVRFKLTGREALAAISEYTNCNIAVKGVFVEGKAVPPPGEKRLHLWIQGPTPEAVGFARIELNKIVNEAVANMQLHAERHGNMPGRYKVL